MNYRRLINLILGISLTFNTFATPYSHEKSLLYYPSLSNELYLQVYPRPNWHTGGYEAIRQRFMAVLDSAAYAGLDKNKYHYDALKSAAATNDSAATAQHALLFIDAVIAYSKDLYAGADIRKQLDNDEVTAKFAPVDDTFIFSGLAGVNSAGELDEFLRKLEPNDNEYQLLKRELAVQLAANNAQNVRQLRTALNYYRWINHFHFDKYIVVNIPSAMLRYYEGGSSKLEMKVVAGKASTPTPLFSSYCNQVVLYPYWNVPSTIGTKELLPKFRKSPAAMDEMNMELIDDHGNVIDHHAIDWASYDQNNFPFIFRQSTGCSNALGVIKFNLTDPFDVYMHDTNLKNKFTSTSRYFSHGCIRLEKPVDLANHLLESPVDSGEVKACLTNRQPTINKIENPVPVFVVYMTPVAEAGAVKYNKDIYNMFK